MDTKLSIFTPVPISIVDVSIDTSSDSFLLICTTTGSPPASVSWMKDNIALTDGEGRSHTQKLVNGSTATFNNRLLITGSKPDMFTGMYLCIATDHQSNEVEQSITTEGLFVSIHCLEILIVFFYRVAYQFQ